jgi:hypothetical protein
MVGEKIVAGGARYARDQGPPPDGARGGAFSFDSSTSHTHLRGCWAAARRRPTINRKHAQKHLPPRGLLHRLRTEKKLEIPLQGGAECLIRGKY